MVALFNYFALIGTFLSVSLLLPAIVGFGTADPASGLSLVVYAALGGFVSYALLNATRGRKISLNRPKAIYLAVFSWMFFPLVLAFPLADVFNISYLDGLFEAVSAFTTTAASGIKNLEAAPPAAIFLRASLQWIGGLATLLTFILFLGPISAGGMPKPMSETGEAMVRTTSAINRNALKLFRYFLGVTLICFALILLSGVDAFSSLILASSAMTAGGYLPAGSELAAIASPATFLILGFFFMFSATNIYWHKMVQRWQLDNLKTHRESYFVIGAILIITIIFALVIVNASGRTGEDNVATMISEAFFNAASLVSTSGLQSRPGIYALIVPSFVLLMLAIGGGCYSASGGIKYYRIGALFFQANNQLTNLIFPNAVTRSKFGTTAYTLDGIKSIWTMMIAFIVVLALGALCLSLTGLAFQASFTASLAAITNAGPAYSLDWVPRGTPGWLAYYDMGISQKLLLSVLMLMGRLEVIVVLVALNPLFSAAR